MKLEIGELSVVSLDVDSFEIGVIHCDTLKEAKIAAKLRVACEEDIAAGMVKIEIRNHKGECLFDYFV